MSDLNEVTHNFLNTPEAKQTASRLNAYKQEIIQERWLSTLILSIHLELEACLEVILASSKLRSEHDSLRSQRANFSTKLSLCASLNLLDPNVLTTLKAINKLRNELAHRLDNKPTKESIYRFVESMSAMHSISVTDHSGQAAKELRTFAAIKAHFSGEEAENLEEFVFVSMMLLRGTLITKVKTVIDID